MNTDRRQSSGKMRLMKQGGLGGNIVSLAPRGMKQGRLTGAGEIMESLAPKSTPIDIWHT